MGIPDGAHTHGSSGGSSGLGTGMPVLVGAAPALKLAAPVVAAVGELVHLLMIVAAVSVGIGAVCVGGLLTGGGAARGWTRPGPRPRPLPRRRWCGSPCRSRESGKRLSYPPHRR